MGYLGVGGTGGGGGGVDFLGSIPFHSRFHSIDLLKLWLLRRSIYVHQTTRCKPYRGYFPFHNLY